ncbi:MAG TPA: energy transducer TonB [Opitutaceae bacterium]
MLFRLVRISLWAALLAGAGFAAEPAASPIVYEAAQVDEVPVVSAQISPTYPPNLKVLRVPDAVTLTFVVDETGAVRDVQVVEPGQPDCDAAAVSAVSRWVYQPARKAGQPVAVRLKQKVAFGFDDSALFDVDQLDRAPMVRYQSKPEYPPDLRRRGIGGEVIVEFIVDERGIARRVKAVSAPHTALAEAAENAVGQWTFFPGMKAGRAVATRLAVPVMFGSAP